MENMNEWFLKFVWISACPEIDPRKYSLFIFDQYKGSLEERIIYSTNSVEQLDIHVLKKKKDSRQKVAPFAKKLTQNRA